MSVNRLGNPATEKMTEKFRIIQVAQMFFKDEPSWLGCFEIREMYIYIYTYIHVYMSIM